MILMRNGRVPAGLAVQNSADYALDEPGCGTQESIKIAAKT